MRYCGMCGTGTNLTSNALVGTMVFCRFFGWKHMFCRATSMFVWMCGMEGKGDAEKRGLTSLEHWKRFRFVFWNVVFWDYCWILVSMKVSNSSGGLPLYPIKTLIQFLLLLQGIALLLSSLSKEVMNPDFLGPMMFFAALAAFFGISCCIYTGGTALFLVERHCDGRNS